MKRRKGTEEESRLGRRRGRGGSIAYLPLPCLLPTAAYCLPRLSKKHRRRVIHQVAVLAADPGQAGVGVAGRVGRSWGMPGQARTDSGSPGQVLGRQGRSPRPSRSSRAGEQTDQHLRRERFARVWNWPGRGAQAWPGSGQSPRPRPARPGRGGRLRGRCRRPRTGVPPRSGAGARASGRSRSARRPTPVPPGHSASEPQPDRPRPGVRRRGDRRRRQRASRGLRSARQPAYLPAAKAVRAGRSRPGGWPPVARGCCGRASPRRRPGPPPPGADARTRRWPSRSRNGRGSGRSPCGGWPRG